MRKVTAHVQPLNSPRSYPGAVTRTQGSWHELSAPRRTLSAGCEKAHGVELVGEGRTTAGVTVRIEIGIGNGNGNGTENKTATATATTNDTGIGAKTSARREVGTWPGPGTGRGTETGSGTVIGRDMERRGGRGRGRGRSTGTGRGSEIGIGSVVETDDDEKKALRKRMNTDSGDQNTKSVDRAYNTEATANTGDGDHDDSEDEAVLRAMPRMVHREQEDMQDGEARQGDRRKDRLAKTWVARVARRVRVSVWCRARAAAA